MDGVAEDSLMKHIEQLIVRYPILGSCKEALEEGYRMLESCYVRGNKLLVAGNGGSAADAEHMSAELMKRFKLKRSLGRKLESALREVDPVRGEYLAKNLEMPLPAISLAAHNAQMTAFMNDVDAVGVFAQQLLGYGKQGDVFLGISTTGNSENILYAAVAAKARGISVLGLTGESGGLLRQLTDVIVRVPERETYKVQELHLPVYHCWCLMLEERFFGTSLE